MHTPIPYSTGSPAAWDMLMAKAGKVTEWIPIVDWF
jgi:hypothetical protein